MTDITAPAQGIEESCLTVISVKFTVKYCNANQLVVDLTETFQQTRNTTEFQFFEPPTETAIPRNRGKN